MTIERACARVVRKPWGKADLNPWSKLGDDDGAIGELWFERPVPNGALPALLLKLLFTTQTLSIQVHPNDQQARSMGFARGKSEAWYILSATPGAKVAIGLCRRVNAAELRDAIGDGSIMELMGWRSVYANDVVAVPAGTIHAIGAGVVLVEIQQASDATFRMFDFGRQRDLHIDAAMAVADLTPLAEQPPVGDISAERTVLVTSSHFIFERIELPPLTNWRLSNDLETWLVVIDGRLHCADMTIDVGGALFLERDAMNVMVGSSGARALIAYPGPAPQDDLLIEIDSIAHALPRNDVECEQRCMSAIEGRSAVSSEVQS